MRTHAMIDIDNNEWRQGKRKRDTKIANVEIEANAFSYRANIKQINRTKTIEKYSSGVFRLKVIVFFFFFLLIACNTHTHIHIHIYE